MRLTDFKVLTFDCYGTLIDWESGMVEALKPLAGKAASPLGRNAILEAHARHESLQQAQTPTMAYRDLLAIVYKRLAEEWRVPVDWQDCVAYGKSVRDWPAFPDTAGALQYLKKRYRLVILSNVDNETFGFSKRKLGVEFDAIYTAEDIGSYKPSLRNFEYMLANLDALGFGKQDVLHTAESMFHDHRPANQMGLKSCWIYRRHLDQGFGATMPPGEMPAYDFQFKSMAEFAKAHQDQVGS